MFKKKQEWQLRDLRLLDGVASESLDMRLDLEERYTWTCATLQEKEAFLKAGGLYFGLTSVPPLPRYISSL